MAKKVIKNITIDQGATFSETVSVTTDGSTVKNLTGYTTTSQFRKAMTVLLIQVLQPLKWTLLVL